MKSRKVALVTGCSSGMGREIAQTLSKEGIFVYATSRTPQKLMDIESELLKPIYMDITDINSVKEALEPIETIDIVVNNAGFGLVSTVEDVTEEQMLKQFDVNVFGVFRVCRIAIPKMRRQNAGVIINISSFLGKIGLPLFTFYNASKYALEGITDSLRYELKDFNIRVHSIMPGFFDTNFARDNLVVNEQIYNKNSPYAKTIETLIPVVTEEINNGNSTKLVVTMVLDIVNNANYPARNTVGDKASKFIPMKQELSDEEFERRVIDYYRL